MLVFHFQTESPLLVRPYLPYITKSELHAVMTAGFSTIAGSVLGAYISFGVRQGKRTGKDKVYMKSFNNLALLKHIESIPLSFSLFGFFVSEGISHKSPWSSDSSFSFLYELLVTTCKKTSQTTKKINYIPTCLCILQLSWSIFCHLEF